MELDPRQAEARATLGLVYMNYDWNWSKAEEEFTRAIDLEPSNANAHLWYALLLDYSGRTEDAYDQFKKAC